MTRLRMVLMCALLFSSISSCAALDRWLFRDMLRGEHYVGVGTVRVEHALEGFASGSASESDLRWDAVRLNRVGDAWYFDVNDVTVVEASRGASMKLYLSLKLDGVPTVAQTHGGFLFGPRLDFTVYSPARFPARGPPDPRRIAERSLHDGIVRFTAAETRINGSLRGGLSFRGRAGRIAAEFDLKLVAPPPLF